MVDGSWVLCFLGCLGREWQSWFKGKSVWSRGKTVWGECQWWMSNKECLLTRKPRTCQSTLPVYKGCNALSSEEKIKNRTSTTRITISDIHKQHRHQLNQDPGGSDSSNRSSFWFCRMRLVAASWSLRLLRR